MKNLVYQYYIPYESGDKDIGGTSMPEWARAGSRSAQAYANSCNAEYLLSHERYFPDLDPRLDSLKLFHDPQFDQYDNILCLDLDMLISTHQNLFKFSIDDVAMVHELGVHTGGPSGWIRRVMEGPIEQRGVIAYGKKLFGDDWMFPKSSLYPTEKYRYLNGGLQLWSKSGRLKAREHFTSVHDYVLHTRYTEQMYLNIQLSQPMFKVTELNSIWNRLPYQWAYNKPDGYINHFLARNKFNMPKLERTELSICQNF